MLHGISNFFGERRHFERRVAALTFGVAMGGLALLLWVTSPLAPEALRRIRIARFGYEGETQFVRRIYLKSEGSARALNAGPRTIAFAGSRRGGNPQPRSRRATTLPENRPRLPMDGEALENRIAYAMARSANVPLVQSEDLVIEELVRPSYPEEARDQGIEGRIAVLALVDTTGRISEVEIMDGEEFRLLAEAAAEAVWKCRFRPYIKDGQIQPVYAMFRFNFAIY